MKSDKNILTWKALKSLNELYEKGVTQYVALAQFPDVKFLIENTQQLEADKKQIFVKKPSFNTYYEQRFKLQFENFTHFLEENRLSSFDNLALDNIWVLQKIAEDKDKLINVEDLTLKELSSLYFKDSKDVKEGSNLYKAVCNILDKSDFTKSEQYLKILHCKTRVPKAILICENDNQLYKNRKNAIEIWILGGKNFTKLDFIPIPNLPIFYLGDFDQDGIDTFINIQKRIPNIELILPNNYKSIAKSITDSEHDSLWRNNYEIEKLPLTEKVKEILLFLYKENKWIEEESILVF